jgi:hypothetical protein
MPSRFGTSKEVLAMLVAGFAGVLNVVGLKSSELAGVLRDDPVPVSIVTFRRNIPSNA